MLGTSFKKKVSPSVGYPPPRARKKFRQGEISAPEALYEAWGHIAAIVVESLRKYVHLSLLTASGGLPTHLFS